MGLFKSRKQRELEAEIQVRQSKAKIKRFISTAHKVQQRYWGPGQAGPPPGRPPTVPQLGGGAMHARDQANKWERYLLQLETLSVRRDEMAAADDFIKGIMRRDRFHPSRGDPRAGRRHATQDGEGRGQGQCHG